MTRRTDITVVIPTYNSGDRIEATLASVAAQGGIGWEIVVVDDASTDDTPERAEAFARGLPEGRVTVWRGRVNQGQNVSRNFGLGFARGRWIKFLDHDDLLVPGSLAHQLRLAEKHDVLAAIGGCQRFEGDPPTNVEISPANEEGIEIFDNPLLACEAMSPTFNEILIRKDTVEEIGGFNRMLGTCEEFDLFCRLRLAHPTGRVLYQPEPPLCLKRIHPASLAKKLGGPDKQDNWGLLCRIYLARHILAEGIEITPDLRRHVFDELYQFSMVAYADGMEGAAVSGHEVWKRAGLPVPEISSSYVALLHRLVGFRVAERLRAAVRGVVR